MPIPSVSGSTSHGHSSGSVSSLTVSHTSNGNPLWIIAVLYRGALAFGTCTFNSVTAYPVFRNATSNFQFQIFLVANPGSVTANIVFTPAVSNFIALAGYNISGGANGCRMGDNNVTGTSSSVVIRGTATDELIIDIIASDLLNQNFTEGQTLIFEEVDASSNVKIASSQKAAINGDVTMSWTLSGSNLVSQLALLFPPTSTGGGSGEKSSVF